MMLSFRKLPLAPSHKYYRSLSAFAVRTSSPFQNKIAKKRTDDNGTNSDRTFPPIRNINFASTEYKSCFGNLPKPDVTSLRESTINYLETRFDPKKWYDEPITTLLLDEKLSDGTLRKTTDAFGNENGTILHATSEEVDRAIHHASTYRSPHRDLRSQIRIIESHLLSRDAPFLIGNQAVDFWKQDGITEMEESEEANVVERRMNDSLLRSESEGKIDIGRRMAFVGCVSNFSNFLDLFRKALRNLECGVPVLILSRGNTAQHSYRWAELLKGYAREEGIDEGMVSFVSCTADDAERILKNGGGGPMYVTCSRELARTIKSEHPNTIASTGGPNTLVASKYSPEMGEAISLSACIESSGQCTALRHVVCPGLDRGDLVEGLFADGESVGGDILESLKAGSFAGIKEGVLADPVLGKLKPYVKHEKRDVYYRIDGELPPDDDIEEHWRRVVVDVTTEIDVDRLSHWLVRNQPISLAMNMDDKNQARDLFEKTGLVVYTVGTNDNPALTCQARPQESEVFGEFPVRRDLSQYTKYPVIVPSSTPSYNSTYLHTYLKSLNPSTAIHTIPSKETDALLRDLLQTLQSDTVRGYCIEIANYLSDATSTNGPNVARGTRTVLWGLQRPPMNGTKTLIRLNGDDGDNMSDRLLPSLLPFLITNARDQVEVSIDPSFHSSSTKKLTSLLESYIPIVSEDQAAFLKRSQRTSGGETNDIFYNVVTPDGVMEHYPMVGNFVSLFLSMGHIKSTAKNDEEFVKFFGSSEKWLKMI